jgi:hypothetical protein
VVVTGVEVAMDHYPAGPTVSLDLESAVIYMVKNLAKPPSGRQVVAWRDRYPSGLEKSRFMSLANHPRDVRQRLVEGATVQLGEVGAADTARAYAKTYDSSDNEAYANLPASQHRARLERTLTDEACPFNTFDGWRAYRFEALLPRFKLRCFLDDDPAAAPLLQCLRARRREHGSSGAPDDEAKRIAHKRMTPNHTAADPESYELYRAALRRLSTSQRRS